MEMTKGQHEEKVEKYEEDSLKGTLFSTLVFVGGGIVLFIILLFALYMIRL
ncbi:MAG TPA: hypothetical protein VK072_09075 [Candidatus Avamphibacillus sp.]|nr:hypothetical protein [Candidatus Avamphibacillus sp.]